MANDARSTLIEEPPAGAVAGSGKAARGAKAGKEKGEEKLTPGPPRSVWREYFESLVVTAIMAFFGMTFVVQAVKVPTGSMQNTITIGDHLLVNKFIFAPGPPLPFLPMREIRRGDIIVFKYPGSHVEGWTDNLDDPGNKPYVTNYVKRVIGLPGDRIELIGTQVVVNGQVLPEHTIIAENPPDDSSTETIESNAPLVPETDPRPQHGEPYSVYYSRRPHHDYTSIGGDVYPLFKERKPVVVPANSYYVMGDNRDNSLDSRYWGFVPRDLVIGRAMFVYWNYDESKPSTGFPYIQDFFTHTRWSRTGTMIK